MSPWVEGPLYGYLATGRIRLSDGEAAFVASVHAPAEPIPDGFAENLEPEDLEAMRLSPPVEWPEKSRVWYSDLAFEALDRSLEDDSRFLIGGDWNTARLFDSFFDAPPTGAAFFLRAHRRGWHDCHSYQNEERTFLKPGTRPLQLDHLFCDSRTGQKVLTCNAWDNELVRELSDHAPVVAEFESL